MNGTAFPTTRRRFLVCAGAVAAARFNWSIGAETGDISPQPYFAEVSRALQALSKFGAPMIAADAGQIAALALRADSAAVNAAEKILNRYTLVRVDVDPEGPLVVSPGGAEGLLVEQGWRLFLVRLANSSGDTGTVDFATVGRSGLSFMDGTLTPGHISFEPQSDVVSLAPESYLFDTVNKGPVIQAMWLTSKLEGESRLSGVSPEYRVVQLFSRDRGRRTADLSFVISPKSSMVFSTVSGHREFSFNCVASSDIVLRVTDTDGRGCVASVTIKDKVNRVYPPQAMRLAPDLAFQPQVYRADGEAVRLPDGEYTVECRRGPEYLRCVQTVMIGAGRNRIDIQLERWIDPAKWGWYSGDTHIHAGGCAHYQSPTEGVAPETMIRQVRGEGLSIGDILTWGPSWYYQKKFFTGHAVSPAATLEQPQLQLANNASLQPKATPQDYQSTLRYDVEVSGFPSSHAGHLVLLRLKDQDFPGTVLIEDWPSWNLPILRWARAQDAVAGYAHCGHGMVVDSTELPNYEIPPMDGLGTQEAIVDVTHGLVDFLSGCDTQPVAELNAWYHMLNCGFRMAMVGETDYPCITDERLGAGRSYVRVKQRPVGDAGYEAWIRGLQKGMLYCGDGRSHFLDFKVNGHRSGEDDLRLRGMKELTVEAVVAARLEPELTQEAVPKRTLPASGWHLEWARIGKTREVPLELVVNGRPVATTTFVADGTPRLVRFKTPIAVSSWLALRILPSAHTHPVFATVSGKPLRASKRSAQWCRACVDKVWEVKSPLMRESERGEAAAAFDHARKSYDTIAGECETA